MGQVKTGTTALQGALHDARRDLRRRGILYPHFGGAEFAHHLLLPLVEDPTRLPAGQLRGYGDADTAVDRAWEAWNATCAAIESQPLPRMILSSEFLLQHTGDRAKARLAALLGELTADVTPIVYVRHPVDHFRSRLQEWLKVENRPLPLPHQTLREAIAGTEAAFAQPPGLVPFDRTSLRGGDITTDFTARFLAGELPLAAIPPRDGNPGLSAEALVLLARLRSSAGAGPDARKAVIRLIRPLAALDRVDPPARPLALLPEVATAVLRAATCHRWLAETGRLVLPGLELSRIDGTPLPDWLVSAPPETLFPHDPLRLDRLVRALRETEPGLPQKQAI